MRQPPCEWLSRDDTGRPSCEHGPAFKVGSKWSCRVKLYQRIRRYRESDKGRAQRQRENQSANAKSSKALYDLTRVRVS